MPSDALLEEIEQLIPRSSVGKVCDSRVARPRDNGREEDTDQQGSLHAVHHQKDGQEAAR